jgi:rhodanese-related sulfurtransferase
MEISVQELHQKLQAGEKFVFIDVREPWEYEEFNLGAQLIPVGTIMNAIPDLEDHKNDEIALPFRRPLRYGPTTADGQRFHQSV